MNMIYEILYFLLIGLFAGLIGGLLGVGGGFIFIPAQLLVYNYFEIPKELQIKLAIATSLAAVVFNVAASSYVHHINNAIYFPLIKKIIVGIILGSVIGAFVAEIFPSYYLEIIFGIFECLFGVYFIFSPNFESKTPFKNLNYLILNILIIFTSALSIILGVGGGIFLIPLLTLLHLPLRQAIGSSSLATLMVAMIGALVMIIPTLESSSTPYAFGYLYLPAFIPLSIGAIMSAPFGAKLTHTIPVPLLKRIFGGFLIILGIIVLIR